MRQLLPPGQTRTYLYDEMKEDRFPKPVRVGRRSLWPLSEVQRWIALQKSTRDRGSPRVG
ncbi:helix-turn-helix transcriptional regulator [Xanthomonas oryzae]|uniref:helix-turn-helix transcriptional regulator n=1 Tax=Xanthomonas oryzae TaxID=347 RepID=UPI0009AD408F|nr:AlpA family phage regulatory protein [Xanthomonas oryzae]